MSFIFRRSLSTLIPPKIASPANLGSNPAAKRMQNIVSFYSKLPRGHAPTPVAKTVFAKYREKYRNTGKPVFHVTMALLISGYALNYYFVFRHEKGEEGL